jgi:hypothetical protein
MKQNLFDPGDPAMAVVNCWSVSEEAQGCGGLQVMLPVNNVGDPGELADAALYLDSGRIDDFGWIAYLRAKDSTPMSSSLELF